MNEGNASFAESLLSSAEKMLAARKPYEALRQMQRARYYPCAADRCSAGMWVTNMLLGRFEAAWRQSDAIRKRGAPDVHRLWQGEGLGNRRVILRCLHGFGDAVQFLRFAPLLRDVASTMIVEVPPKLLKLAPSFDGVDEVITWGDQAPAYPPKWDVQIEVMQLPYLFRTTLSDLPIRRNYLQLRTPKQRVHTSGVFDVGLVWTAGAWNASRSIPQNLLTSVLDVQNCRFWNLQGESSGTAVCDDFLNHLRVDVESRNSIEELAARIAQLDLVITVDTLAAHLAGALNIPAYVMLPYEADWRWLHKRSDSPWYPSLRLFRQAAPGDWHPVVEAVQQALRKLVQAAPARGHIA